MRKKAPESRKGGLTASEAHQQGIGSGVVRAQNLASGKAVSQETVNRMHAFFSRHEKNKHGPKGEVAWALWGGDPGKRWADANAVTKDEQVKQAMVRRGQFEKLALLHAKGHHARRGRRAVLLSQLNRGGRDKTKEAMYTAFEDELEKISLDLATPVRSAFQRVGGSVKKAVTRDRLALGKEYLKNPSILASHAAQKANSLGYRAMHDYAQGGVIRKAVDAVEMFA